MSPIIVFSHTTFIFKQSHKRFEFNEFYVLDIINFYSLIKTKNTEEMLLIKSSPVQV